MNEYPNLVMYMEYLICEMVIVKKNEGLMHKERGRADDGTI